MYKFKKYQSVIEFYELNSRLDFKTFVTIDKKGTRYYYIACMLISETFENNNKYKRVI